MSKERKDVLVAWLYPALAVLSQASLKAFMAIVEKNNSVQRAYFFFHWSELIVSKFPVKSKYGLLFIVSHKE